MWPLKFYETKNGNRIVLDFLREFSLEDRAVFGGDLRTLQLRYPLGMPLCRHLRGDLWELRSSLPSKREMRLIYCRTPENDLMVLNAFIKKTPRTPPAEIDLAERRRRDLG